ncbi:MAG TPA: tRNA epoxyqueuosine(34) reductase QueG [Vicinamibacterales bacterium]
MPLTSAVIKRRARELGFDACGIAPATAHPELRFFSEWLSRGYAASMAYLSRSAATRADVRQLLPSARSVIALATLYNTGRPYSTECADPGRAKVARYAWGDDYHDVIGRRLDALIAWMHEQHPDPFEAAPYVDTGPVQERVYAQHAGIGWIGKNACVINERLGSFIFLAEIICSLPLEPDPPSLDQCGTCTLCLEACPTAALVAPGVLDSNRCISYLTIEHRGAIPDEVTAAIGSHVYGCDVCQEVCPWNGAAPVSSEPAWQPRPVWDQPALVDLLQMDDRRLRGALDGSAMKRARVDGLRRNLEVASANAAAKKSKVSG